MLWMTLALAEPCEGRFAVEWTRPSWWTPRRFTGELELTKQKKRCLGRLSFDQTSADFGVGEVVLGADTFDLTVPYPKGALRFRGVIDGPTVRGHLKWLDIDWSPATATRIGPTLFVDDAGRLEVASPESVGLDPLALGRFVAEAEHRHSLGLVVLVDGKAVVARAFGSAQGSLMSITKPLASLAVPFLLAEGHLESLDQPLGTVFEAWSDPGDPRHGITTRHVLTHTSGLKHERLAQQLNTQPDRVAVALTTELQTAPGEAFSYNNRAFALLAGLVRETAGEDIESYLRPRLFEPLGLDVVWSRDEVGNPDTYGGAGMRTLELATLGQLMLQDGIWEGEQVLPEGWVEQASQPAREDVQVGLGWFTLDRDAPVQGIWHSGSRGQWLVVVPERRLVVARLHPGHEGTDATEEWGWFLRDVLEVVAPPE